MVDEIRCFVEGGNAFERFVCVVPALVLTVDEHRNLDGVRMDADDPSLKVLAGNAHVVAELQLGPGNVVPCHALSL